MMKYITEPLNADHDRSDFSCGKSMLDYYIQKQARQDMKRRLAVVFVVPDENNRVKGFYTLSNYNVSRDDVPESLRKKMPPSYETLPTTLLGRLAVDNKFKGNRLGESILFDALYRSLEISDSSCGPIVVVVGPLDNEAVSFYGKYGFITLPDRGRMFLPMKTIKNMFREKS